MAANIEIRTIGGEEIASFIENGKKERAWHRLGQVYDRPLTAVEALQGAHADFEVESRDVFFMTNELKDIISSGRDIKPMELMTYLKQIEGKKANVRNDYEEALGVVSDSYGIVQNKEAFDFVDLLTTGELGNVDKPTIECAGLLGNGERVFITAKFHDPVVLDNGRDTIDMYVVFTSSHDGKGAVNCLVTGVRVVCNNTLNFALHNNVSKLSYRHTRHVANRLRLDTEDNAQRAYKTLNLYNAYKETFKERLQQLAQVEIANEKALENLFVKSCLKQEYVDAYIQNNFRLNTDEISSQSKNLIANLMESTHTGIGQNLLKSGTGLWAINGLTNYYQNVKNWTGDETKFKSIMDGDTLGKLQKLYDELLAA